MIFFIVKNLLIFINIMTDNIDNNDINLNDIKLDLEENTTENNEIKIVVCGPVDAGKSSLIGVLNNGILDDGRGLSRNKVLKHNHELITGRTSNITVNVYQYKTLDGKICLIKNNKNVKTIGDYFVKNDRTVNLIDLAGHEKYLKTTVFGVLAYYPNYGIVVIGANTGITRLTKEHLGIMLYLDIPFTIVVTKVDIAPKKIYLNLMKRLNELLRSVKKEVFYISKNNGDLEMAKFINKKMYNKKIPIITISNKTGLNINNLHYLINNIPIVKKDNKLNYINIDSTFFVKGIGLIVCGTSFGKFKIKNKYYIGPYNGKYYQISIRSIHNSLQENVTESEDNKYCSFAIKFTNPKEILERKQIIKGMVIIDNVENTKYTSSTFHAKVKILHHSTLIKTGYSPLVHIGSIRQCAKLSMLEDNKLLKTGQTALIEFKFLYRPEFIKEGERIFFRDGATKGVGKVVKVIND